MLPKESLELENIETGLSTIPMTAKWTSGMKIIGKNRSQQHCTKKAPEVQTQVLPQLPLRR